jgi:acetyl esterase/lipase
VQLARRSANFLTMKSLPQIILALAIVQSMNAAQLVETGIRSSHDGKTQQALWYAPENSGKKPVPLLVLLHTWSGNYQQKNWKELCLAECEKRGWALIHPDFRGPNRRPEACASEAAVQDVLDAVKWIRKQAKVDAKRIYLAGTSGGGHMSLVMAGRAPKLWAGVSAWVPISDLAAWQRECTAAGRHYAKEVAKVCGGEPGASAMVDAQYRHRSPLTWLPQAEGVNLDINAGIHDGYTGSVPVSHSLHAFNTLAKINGHPGEQLSPEQIAFFRMKRKVPAKLIFHGEEEPDRIRKILFRRKAGAARVTIFDGGHEGDMKTAVEWLANQSR